MKTKFDSPQNDGNIYNKIVSLDRINCASHSEKTVQETDYMDGTVTYAGPGYPLPEYGTPGTFGAAIIDVACGTK